MEVRHLSTLSNACSLILLAFYTSACGQPLPASLSDLVTRLDHSFKTRQSSQIVPWVLSAEQRHTFWLCPANMQPLLTPPTLFDLSEAWPLEPMQPSPLSDLVPIESVHLRNGMNFADCQIQSDLTLHKVVLHFGDQSLQKTLHIRVVEHEGVFYLLGL